MRIPLSQALVFAVVTLAPLPRGSAETSWIAVWCVVLAGAIAIADLRKLRPSHVGIVAPAFATYLLLIAIVWIQSLPGAPLGTPNPQWAEAEQLLGSQVTPYLAATAFPLWTALGPSLALFLAFMGGFLVSIGGGSARALLLAVGGAGALYALYALGEFVGLGLLSNAPAATFVSLTVPFANRDHAAVYFGTCSLLWFLLLLDELHWRVAGLGLSVSKLGSALVLDAPWKVFGSAGAFLVCITAMFLTLSRAGILLSLAVLAFCGGLFAWRSFSRHPRSFALVGLIVLVSVAFAEVWGGGLAYRLGGEGLADRSRAEVYASTSRIIRDFPVFGTGLGTFEEIFPAYHDARLRTNAVWDRAHNSLLELAAELGLPLAAVTAALWLYLGVRLMRGVSIRKRDSIIPLAGLGTAVLGTLHSLVDFPLQIPGYAIVWASVAGCGLAQSVSSLNSSARTGPADASSESSRGS